jgi:hypothetical protein
VTRVQGLIKDVLATTPDEIDQDVFEPGMLTSMPLIELRDRAEFTVDYRYVSRAQLSRRLCRQQVRPHERHVRPMNCDGHVAAISESLNRHDGVLDRYDEVEIHADDLHRKMTFENRSQHFVPAAL